VVRGEILMNGLNNGAQEFGLSALSYLILKSRDWAFDADD